MKKFVLGLIVMLIIATSATAFAWWDILITQREQETLELSEGVRMELTNQTVESQGQLIPIGSFYQGEVGYTTSYVFTYDLILGRDVGRDLDVIIEIANLKVGDVVYDGITTHKVLNILVESSFGTFISDATYSSTVTSGNTLMRLNKVINHESIRTITITITLEPQTEAYLEADYLAVAGKNITFDITFEIPVLSLQSE